MKCPGCGNRVKEGDPVCPVCRVSLPMHGIIEDISSADDNDQFLLLLRDSLGEKYKIIREIGRGGMGIVYECLDLTLDRKVAMKILPGEFSFNPEFKERFKNEIKILAQLKHPGIVTIYTAGEAGGHLYFTMDYIEGKTLADELEKKGKIPIIETLGIVRNICMALEHAHGKNIIHRDLSPENIMIANDGNIYIMDFGISKVFSGTGVTTTGSIMGKAPYMSPEQCRGEQLDTRSDIYSLGIMIYQMISGFLPFDGDTASVMYRQVNENIKPVKDLCPDLPAEIESMISGCLNKNRDKRTGSASELREKCSDALESGISKVNIKKIIPPFRNSLKLKWIIRLISVLILIPVIIYMLLQIFHPDSIYDNPGEIRLDEKYYSLFLMSYDGTAFAYVAKVDSGNYHVTVKNKSTIFKGNNYDEISNLHLSDYGKHHCYSARKGENWFVVYDNREDKLYSRIRHLSLSDDGKILSYIGVNDGTDNKDKVSTGVIVHKGTVSETYDNIGSLLISSDGKHYVAEVSTGGKWLDNGNYSGGKRYIVYDGKHSGAFDYTGLLSLSEDGKHYLCKSGKLGIWSGSGYYTKGKYYIIYDGNLSRGFDYIGTPSLSSDGLHYTADVVLGRDIAATESYRSSKSFILYDNRLSPPYDYTTEPVLSIDGTHYISAVRSGNKWYILYDNMTGEPYDQIINTPVLSSNGEHYAAIVRKNDTDSHIESNEGKFYIIYDGIAGNPFDNITDLHLGIDGKNYTAITAEGGKWQSGGKYTDGVFYLNYNGVKSEAFDYIGNVLLSIDGTRYVYYTATGGRWTKDGIYHGGRYSIYKNGEVVENNLYSVNKIWLKGYNWGYSAKRKPGSSEEDIEKSFTGSGENPVSEVYINSKKSAMAYIETIKDVSFLIIEKI